MRAQHPIFARPVFFLLGLVLATLTQCSKEATHGPNVEVTVDGRQFSKPIAFTAAFEEKTLFLEAVGEKGFESFIIQVLGFHGTGTYSFEKPGVVAQDNLMMYLPSPASGQIFWNWANLAGPGFLEVTYFDPNGSITANFSCRLHDDIGTGDSIEIKGRIIDFPVEKKLPDSVSPEYASATVDGSDFIGYVETTLESGDFLKVVGREGSARAIGLLFPKDIFPGLYDLSTSSIFNMAYEDLQGNYPAESGTLSILSNDKQRKEIRGKFQFAAKDGHLVSGGEFFAKY